MLGCRLSVPMFVHRVRSSALPPTSPCGNSTKVSMDVFLHSSKEGTSVYFSPWERRPVGWFVHSKAEKLDRACLLNVWMSYDYLGGH